MNKLLILNALTIGGAVVLSAGCTTANQTPQTQEATAFKNKCNNYPHDTECVRWKEMYTGGGH